MAPNISILYLLLDFEIGMDPGIHHAIQGRTGLAFAVVKGVVLLSAPSNHFALFVVER
jgi:hypothetical protein